MRKKIIVKRDERGMREKVKIEVIKEKEEREKIIVEVMREKEKWTKK